MTAPQCGCGVAWSVETPPTSRYPRGRIMHYCKAAGARYEGREPATDAERQLVWGSVLGSSRQTMPRVGVYLDALIALMIELQPSGLRYDGLGCDLADMAERVWSSWSELTALECRVASERFREWRALFDVGSGPIVQLDNINLVTPAGGEAAARSQKQPKRED